MHYGSPIGTDLHPLRGGGIGNIFSNIFRGLVPIAKSLFGIGKSLARTPGGQRILRTAQKSAVNAGLDIASDALSGENVIQSAKRNVGKVGKNLLRATKNEMSRVKTGNRSRRKRGGGCSHGLIGIGLSPAKKRRRSSSSRTTTKVKITSTKRRRRTKKITPRKRKVKKKRKKSIRKPRLSVNMLDYWR